MHYFPKFIYLFLVPKIFRNTSEFTFKYKINCLDLQIHEKCQLEVVHFGGRIGGKLIGGRIGVNLIGGRIGGNSIEGRIGGNSLGSRIKLYN